MKITILNGNPEASSFDAYLIQLKCALEASHHSVEKLDLRNLPLRHCVGCFGCRVKTPGECVARDASLEMDRGLFTQLQALGAGLAENGRLDPGLLKTIASPERYPAVLGQLFQVFLRLPVAHSYFDGMLKKNGAFERRFARPFSG